MASESPTMKDLITCNFVAEPGTGCFDTRSMRRFYVHLRRTLVDLNRSDSRKPLAGKSGKYSSLLAQLMSVEQLTLHSDPLFVNCYSDQSNRIARIGFDAAARQAGS